MFGFHLILAKLFYLVLAAPCYDMAFKLLCSILNGA